MSIDGGLTILATLVVAVATYVFRKSKSSKEKAVVIAPPNNNAADKAIGSVQESLKEEIDRIKAATDGDSPADDLADLANARKRR